MGSFCPCVAIVNTQVAICSTLTKPATLQRHLNNITITRQSLGRGNRFVVLPCLGLAQRRGTEMKESRFFAQATSMSAEGNPAADRRKRLVCTPTACLPQTTARHSSAPNRGSERPTPPAQSSGECRSSAALLSAFAHIPTQTCSHVLQGELPRPRRSTSINLGT